MKTALLLIGGGLAVATVAVIAIGMVLLLRKNAQDAVEKKEELPKFDDYKDLGKCPDDDRPDAENHY